MKIGVYCGTFDPITYGHIDIIERAAKITDKLIVAVLENPDKKKLFSVNERVDMIQNVIDKAISKFDISNLYKKLAFQIINEPDNNSEEKTNLYDNFEKEFGRTLSPMEYQLISGWLDSNYSEEIINCALKEAVFNGVSNLKYIDKILYEWSKKGITKKEDELYSDDEYDWLNDE